MLIGGNSNIQVVHFAPGSVALVGYQEPLSKEARGRVRANLERQIKRAVGFKVSVVLVSSDLSVLAVATVTKVDAP
jgi:hypothetical protein